MSASRFVAAGLLVLSGVISYLAWQNAQLTPYTMNLSREHACDLDSSCIVLDDQARVGKADVLRHRYEYKTTHGMVTVTCQRAAIFVGEWACKTQEGRLVSESGI